MITATNLLYSKSALARILGIDAKLIARFEVWHSVIFAVIKGRRPCFFSKKIFKIHFVEWRQKQSKALTAVENAFNPNIYRVRNEGKGTVYTVNFFNGGATCECEDWQNQSQFFGMACCKHIYCVLNQLGFTSFRDYIAQRRAIAKAIASPPPAA
jgi:hypothetical protein